MVLYRICFILLLIVVTGIFIYFGSQIESQSDSAFPQSFESSWELYGWFTILLYLCQFLSLLALPQALFNFLGFVIFNPFPDDPVIEVEQHT